MTEAETTADRLVCIECEGAGVSLDGEINPFTFDAAECVTCGGRGTLNHLLSDGDADELETALVAMREAGGDQAISRFLNSLEVDDPRVDIVCGFMEKHGIDD